MIGVIFVARLPQHWVPQLLKSSQAVTYKYITSHIDVHKEKTTQSRRSLEVMNAERVTTSTEQEQKLEKKLEQQCVKSRKLSVAEDMNYWEFLKTRKHCQHF